MKRLCAIALLAAGSTGCGLFHQVNPDTSGLTTNAYSSFEGQKMWSRPLETSVDMGSDDINGQADETSFLWGLVHTGQDDSGGTGGILAMFASLLGGSQAPTDGLIMSAATNAAVTAKVDGIYVTQDDVNKTDILWGLYKHRTAKVTGKSLRVKVIGTVTEERADHARTMTEIGHGKVDVIAPTDLFFGKK